MAKVRKKEFEAGAKRVMKAMKRLDVTQGGFAKLMGVGDSKRVREWLAATHKTPQHVEASIQIFDHGPEWVVGWSQARSFVVHTVFPKFIAQIEDSGSMKDFQEPVYHKEGEGVLCNVIWQDECPGDILGEIIKEAWKAIQDETPAM